MKCSDVKNKIISYLENDLPEKEMAAFEKHLQECADCMYIYNMVKEQWQIIEEEKQVKPDPFYFTRIEQAIANRTEKRTPQPVSMFVKTIQTMAAVILLLLSVGAGIFIGSRFTDNAAAATYTNEYEYYSEIMYLNPDEYEPIENYLLNREEEE